MFLPSHYSDVVDERNICHLCGYPMCGNPLDEQLKQTYHISLAQKKVFDLTERKVHSMTRPAHNILYSSFVYIPLKEILQC